MCASYVYKRRRLQNSVTLLPAPKEAKVSYDLDYCNSSIASTSHPITLLEDQTKLKKEPVNAFPAGETHSNHHSVAGPDINANGSSNPNYASKLEAVESSHKRKGENTSEPYDDNHQNIMSDHNDSVNDSCSSSKSHLEQYAPSGKVESDDMGECSSSEVIVLDPPSGFSSSKDLCMHVLRTKGPSDHSSETVSGALVSDVLGGDDTNFCLPCKICGCMENPKKMLICDHCEGAFHLHCCHERGPFREEWYCKPCSSKNPRPLLDAAMGKSFSGISEEYKRRILEKELGPIQFMLIDTQAYTSKVRIGNGFQADVPEWSTPTNEDDDSFGEPSLLNPAECAHLNGLNLSRPSTLSSIGNWVQCREIVFNNAGKHGSGVICGKWRRAPLFVTQTDDWDCSGAVVWDPIHADCAVPQELDTEEVLKQLKFVEMIRFRLDKKQACGQVNSLGRRFLAGNAA